MGINYFSSITSQTINQAFGTPDDIYLNIKNTALPEAQNYFGIAVSFIALYFFVRAFLR